MTLSEVKKNSTVEIIKINMERYLQRRLTAMGFIVGDRVQVMASPQNLPVTLKVKDSTLIIGHNEASKILVKVILKRTKCMEIKLREMGMNQVGKISKITADRDLGRRIRDMGILPLMNIKIVGEAPMFDPVAIKVGDAVLTLRNNEADYIFVKIDGGSNEN
ncbi:MAG: ferrous iron transport protein A [Bdellovibrionaceae bacterium]|nr:ferrous iron transport protein A [Pseudobdellovibrionaceae bacterium]